MVISFWASILVMAVIDHRPNIDYRVWGPLITSEFEASGKDRKKQDVDKIFP